VSESLRARQILSVDRALEATGGGIPGQFLHPAYHHALPPRPSRPRRRRDAAGRQPDRAVCQPGWQAIHAAHAEGRPSRARAGDGWRRCCGHLIRGGLHNDSIDGNKAKLVSILLGPDDRRWRWLDRGSRSRCRWRRDTRRGHRRASDGGLPLPLLRRATEYLGAPFPPEDSNAAYRASD
jgi:hypothetical protein